ncbi:hypothetical protein RT43_GL000717 [Enterococcus italicus DSM 15952]|nr:hypothetical protein RT43_GL000717 [Enterococcus italicus DSM 15952]
MLTYKINITHFSNVMQVFSLFFLKLFPRRKNNDCILTSNHYTKLKRGSFFDHTKIRSIDHYHLCYLLFRTSAVSHYHFCIMGYDCFLFRRRSFARLAVSHQSDDTHV